MKHLTNNELLTLTKSVDFSQNLYSHILGTTNETGITAIKAFRKYKYLQYADGKHEYFISSTNINKLYDPIVQLSIDKCSFDQNEISLELNYNSDHTLISVELSYDRSTKVLPGTVHKHHVSFDLSNLSSEVVYSNAFTLTVTVSNKLIQELMSVKSFIECDAGSSQQSFYDISETLQIGLNKNGHLKLANPKLDDRHLENYFEIANLRKDKNIVNQLDFVPREFNAVLKSFNDYKYLIVTHPNGTYFITHKNTYILENQDLMYEVIENGSFKKKQRKSIGKKVKKNLSKLLYQFIGYNKYYFIKSFFQYEVKRRKWGYYSYLKGLNKSVVKQKHILVESILGNTLSGNIYYLVQSLNKFYPEYKVIISANNIANIQNMVEFNHINAKVVERGSKQYYKILAESKYLLNDTTFPSFFIKKAAQVYINTWHGTPLKAMGKNMSGNPLALSNSQRNFIQADIVSLPNMTTVNMANDDYMLKNLGLDNIQMNASPRNSIFFNTSRRDELRSILNISTDQTLILWMPTWRGSATDLNNIQKNIELFERMSSIVSKLDDSIVLYAKPHPLMQGKLELEELGLRLAPENVETYDFANITDALITDYSSVMFDYANLNKPIVLDIFDIEEYIEDRGITLDIDSLPFEKTANETELLNALNNLNHIIVDYTEFNKKYNSLENIDAPKHLLEKMFSTDLHHKAITKKKERELIYPGTMLTNGITTSFLNLISNIDTTKRDYVIWLPNNLVKQKNAANINKLVSSGIDYISSPTGIILKNMAERSVYDMFLNRLKLNSEQQSVISNIMRREIDRCFGNIKFDHIIHFTGYDAFVSEVFKEMDAKLHIWVHNDMKAEAEVRNNFNVHSIESTYDAAQTIAVVNDSVKEMLLESYFSETNKKKVISVHNTVNTKEVHLKASEKEEYLTDELNEILNDQENIKFINIGRFSPEKGHVRLINAFSKVKENNPKLKATLFIIAGHGIDYPKIVATKEHSKFSADIYLFENINPFPILKHANLMVMSSYHEGLPMVFFESLALDVPILSTAIPGPKEFLESGYGYTCENSTDGLVNGMQDFLSGEFTQQIKELSEFNDNAIDEFESIFNIVNSKNGKS